MQDLELRVALVELAVLQRHQPRVRDLDGALELRPARLVPQLDGHDRRHALAAEKGLRLLERQEHTAVLEAVLCRENARDEKPALADGDLFVAGIFSTE